MAEPQTTLALTTQERDYLAQLLEETLKETRLEEHRTSTRAYREHVVQHETLIESLLKKLGHTS
jgi:hypothetical protein